MSGGNEAAMVVRAGRGLGGIPLTAVWWRRVVGSALASGACRWRLRGSGRSFSGVVVMAAFPSRAEAWAFARAWGWWCGCRLALRPRRSGGVRVWAVSVPVAAPARSAPAPRRGEGGAEWVPRG